MLIVLEGTISSGKTSLAKKLSKLLGTKAFLEPVKGNIVLPKFYHGNKLVSEGKWKTNPYTFLLQVYFLNMRFRMIKQAMQDDNNILDRSIYGDKIFMKLNYHLGTTTKEEWQVYKSLLSNMMQELPYAAHTKKPDLMIFLDVSLKTQLNHIVKRGRPYELLSNNPKLLNYYKELLKYYKKWYKNYNYSPKMKINGDKYDFVNNKQDRIKVFHMIEDKLISLGKLRVAKFSGGHLD